MALGSIQSSAKTPRAYAAVFAGGVGSRMKGAQIPKQFLQLGGKPIIAHTLQHFQDASEIAAVAVACYEPCIGELKRIVEQYSLFKVEAVVPGGTTGQDSFTTACALLSTARPSRPASRPSQSMVARPSPRPSQRRWSSSRMAAFRAWSIARNASSLALRKVFSSASLWRSMPGLDPKGFTMQSTPCRSWHATDIAFTRCQGPKRTSKSRRSGISSHSSRSST